MTSLPLTMLVRPARAELWVAGLLALTLMSMLRALSFTARTTAAHASTSLLIGDKGSPAADGGAGGAARGSGAPLPAAAAGPAVGARERDRAGAAAALLAAAGEVPSAAAALLEAAEAPPLLRRPAVTTGLPGREER
jgi:hypothetical protein